MTPNAPRRILLTNIRLDTRTGTEIVIQETAMGLMDRGHTVAVYVTSPLGELARALVSAGVIVTNRIEVLKDFAPDVIHANHNVPYLVVRALFPKCPALWFCHDAHAWHDAPAYLPATALYVANSAITRARLLSTPGIPESRIVDLPNATNIDPPEGSPPETLGKVLIVAKYGARHIKPVTAACAALGMTVQNVGGAAGLVASDLAERMQDADLVVATGKAAMEAIALNRPVLCADERGLAGLVTPDVAPAWLARNFGGSLLRHPTDKSAVMSEIGLYDPQAFTQARTAILPKISMQRYLDDIEALHLRALSHRVRPDALSMATALENTLPNYMPGGHYPFKAYDLKKKADARADKLAAELSALKVASFRFGKSPEFNTLKFAAGDAGPALLGEGWTADATTHDTGTITLPASTGWSAGRGFKIEAVIDFPETAEITPATPFPITLRINGQACPIRTAKEYEGKLKGYIYFWAEHPAPPAAHTQTLIDIALTAPPAGRPSFRITGMTLLRPVP